MIETVILALFIVPLICRYKIKPIFTDWAIYPVLFFALIYTYLEYCTFIGDYRLVKYQLVYKILYLSALLVLFLKHNFNDSNWSVLLEGFGGAGLVYTGSKLNDIVMALNNGKMPVFARLSLITRYVKPGMFEKIPNDFHVIGGVSTKLWILSDWIDLGYTIMSPGDVLVRACVFIILFSAVRRMNKRLKNKARV